MFLGTITLSNEFEIRRIDLKAKNKITSKCMEYYGMWCNIADETTAVI